MTERFRTEMARVGTINQVSQTPFQGVGCLSKTFQSSQVHTPLHLDRITNDGQSYNDYINDKKSWLTKPIWGNSSFLKESDTRSLPSTQPEINRKFDISHLEKSHKHFGGGELSYGRSFPIQAKYDVTTLKRSDVRPTDELIPSSNKVDLWHSIINVPFPAEHPISSHTPKFAVFPGQDSPNNTRNGRLALTRSTSLPSFAPSGCDNYVVAEKISGSPHRREIVRALSDSERRPLQWHGHSFNQLVKGPEMPRQSFYPTPPTSVKPDFWDRPPFLSVSQKTAEAQQNIVDAVGRNSEYSQQFSANGLRNVNESTLSTGPTFLNKEKISLEAKKSSDGKEEQPYDTTYAKDYSVDLNTNTSAPTSILRSTSAKKINEAKRNKSVKFSESVTVSNGYQTSSSFVNDLGKGNHQHAVQSLNAPLTAIAPEAQRPMTAPSLQQPSIHTSKPVLLPTAALTQPYTNALPSRQSGMGPGGGLRNDLRRLRENYSKSATHRKFRSDFPENAPDIRRTPDMRITINERRHVIPEIRCHSFYFHG